MTAPAPGAGFPNPSRRKRLRAHSMEKVHAPSAAAAVKDGLVDHVTGHAKYALSAGLPHAEFNSVSFRRAITHCTASDCTWRHHRGARQAHHPCSDFSKHDCFRSFDMDGWARPRHYRCALPDPGGQGRNDFGASARPIPPDGLGDWSRLRRGVASSRSDGTLSNRRHGVWRPGCRDSPHFRSIR